MTFFLYILFYALVCKINNLCYRYIRKWRMMRKRLNVYFVINLLGNIRNGKIGKVEIVITNAIKKIGSGDI